MTSQPIRLTPELKDFALALIQSRDKFCKERGVTVVPTKPKPRTKR